MLHPAQPVAVARSFHGDEARVTEFVHGGLSSVEMELASADDMKPICGPPSPRQACPDASRLVQRLGQSPGQLLRTIAKTTSPSFAYLLMTQVRKKLGITR